MSPSFYTVNGQDTVTSLLGAEDPSNYIKLGATVLRSIVTSC